MQTFTGKEYLKIDIANCFGLDKLKWTDRIHWVNNNEPDLEQISYQAKYPVLFRKAVRAMRLVQQNLPTNHVMGLDATASGIQVLAVLSGCDITAKAVNLVNTGNRECYYTTITQHMNTLPNINVTVDVVKKPVMTVFYGSTAQPKAVFGEGPELIAFYQALQEKSPGAYELMGIFQQYWNPFAEYHQWKLPDGHIARVPVIQTVEKNLEIDECDHMRFAYRAQVIKPKTHSRSLAANIVHSLDGWIVRQMVQAAHKQGFWMAPIHDCFYASPNNMDKVRRNYLTIMQWLADNSQVSSILSDITNRKMIYTPKSTTLSTLIKDADYALS
jgi:hypothetical protein